jgi:hypothetical protein
LGNRGSSVSSVRLDDWYAISWQGQERIFLLFVSASRPALGAHPASYTTGTRSSLTGDKAAQREADNLDSGQVKNAWSYEATSTPPYVFMTWYLVTQGQFYFCLIILVFELTLSSYFHHEITEDGTSKGFIFFEYFIKQNYALLSWKYWRKCNPLLQIQLHCDTYWNENFSS